MERVARPTSVSLLLFFSLLAMAATARSASSTVSRRTVTTDFIKSSCSATRYPALCVQSMSVYANAIKRSPRQMAQTALSVSLAQARSASAFIAKLSSTRGMRPRDRAAMKDCVENVSDSIDRLSQSIREMGSMGRTGSGSFQWHLSNVQTWVSAALTDDTTCVDGFAGPSMSANLRAAVKGRVVNVARVTSNALALVNRFAQKQSSSVKNP